jgi:hypothetical protein
VEGSVHGVIEVIYQHLPGEAENHKNSKDNWYSSQDSNQVSHKYKSEALVFGPVYLVFM